MDKNIITHRDRVLDRILRKNFIGAVITSKDILPSKVNLFDVTADISLEHIDTNKSRLWMDYGDRYYSFDILYNVRMRENTKTIQYIVSCIE